MPPHLAQWDLLYIYLLSPRASTSGSTLASTVKILPVSYPLRNSLTVTFQIRSNAARSNEMPGVVGYTPAKNRISAR